MASQNTVLVAGYLIRDVEIDETKGFVRFVLAVERKASPGGTPRTDYLPISCTGSNASFAKANFRKGTNVRISGEIWTFGKVEWAVVAKKVSIGT